jgi:hypothetical protein
MTDANSVPDERRSVRGDSSAESAQPRPHRGVSQCRFGK